MIISTWYVVYKIDGKHAVMNTLISSHFFISRLFLSPSLSLSLSPYLIPCVLFSYYHYGCRLIRSSYQQNQRLDFFFICFLSSTIHPVIWRMNISIRLCQIMNCAHYEQPKKAATATAKHTTKIHEMGITRTNLNGWQIAM